MQVKLSELIEITNKAISNYGYSESEAKIIADVLLYAQLRGNNQGIVKLIGNGIPKRSVAVPTSLDKETDVSALVNGGKNHAMLVMDYVTDLAITKAKKSGIAIVGNYNTDESTGALGYYVNKIADQGLIGFAVASAPFATTAPHGSSEALFCTNPMAYGIPTTENHIIVDFSTSAIAYYGLIEAKTSGRKLAQGLGYDSDGNETNDPVAIMGGAIKTFGGHKGSALALVVQVLAGALVKADSFNSDSDNAGNLVMAIDPNLLNDAPQFKAESSRIVEKVKSAKKLPGVDEILIPGERGNTFYREVMDSGVIEIEDNLYKALT